MTRIYHRPFCRLALIGALVAALGLAACGRKGPLDLPPGASVTDEVQPVAPTLMRNVGGQAPAKPIGGKTAGDSMGVDADGQPIAPTGAKKRIPLDVLLN